MERSDTSSDLDPSADRDEPIGASAAIEGDGLQANGERPEVDRPPEIALPQPASGWVLPSASPGPGPRARRVLGVVAWTGSILLLLAVGWTTANLEAEDSPWRLGYMAGTAAGALALATVLRWLWLRVRHSTAGLASPWIPLVAAGFAVALLGSTAVEAGKAPDPVDPASLLRAGPAYVLSDADPDVVEELELIYAEQNVPSRGMAVANIEASDGSTGLIVVLDLAVPELTSALTLEGMIIGAGDGNPQRDRIAGRDVMLADTDGIILVGWVDAPLVALLYGPDEPTARSMAESVIDAND